MTPFDNDSFQTPIPYPREKMGHLLKQVRWVTRITASMSSAANVDDIYSVLVSGLLSPLGFNYCNALLFEVDHTEGVIRGKYSCGYDSEEEIKQVKEELESEARYLEKRKKELSKRAESDDETAKNELQILDLGSQWMTVFQHIGGECEESDNLGKYIIPLDETQSEPTKSTLFSYAQRFSSPALVDEEKRKEIVVPWYIEEVFEKNFVILPLRVKQHLFAFILIDRGLTDIPITKDDLDALDWYITQGALAIHNSKLINDLEHANQEMRAVDALKSNFLSIISHELRTPLTAITGFVELILNSKVGPITDSQKNLLTRVAKNTGHLNNIVNDLIEISEFEAEGVTDIQLEPIDPLTTLYGMLSKLEYRRRDHKVNVEPVFVNQIQVPQVISDISALERIYFQLLDNAVKFSPHDNVVRVEFELYDEKTLAISICDKGQGIAPDQLQRIFDQFYQVDNSLTRAHEGLGLGLAVTKLLVQATRGEIKVHSIVGEGSRFTILYPISKKKTSHSKK